MSNPMKFADFMFGYEQAESDFSDKLIDCGFGDFEKVGGDWYDCSVEFYKVANDARLNEKTQKAVFDAGFLKAYLNHNDGWETHYGWPRGEPFEAKRGWRRKRTAEGNFLISYWPEGWGDMHTGQFANWLTSGYMTIIEDVAALSTEERE